MRYVLYARRRVRGSTVEFRRHEGASYTFTPSESGTARLELHHADGSLSTFYEIPAHEQDQSRMPVVLYDRESFGGAGGFVRLPFKGRAEESAA